MRQYIRDAHAYAKQIINFSWSKFGLLQNGWHKKKQFSKMSVIFTIEFRKNT